MNKTNEKHFSFFNLLLFSEMTMRAKVPNENVVCVEGEGGIGRGSHVWKHMWEIEVRRFI